jgi:hypothetical protein
MSGAVDFTKQTKQMRKLEKQGQADVDALESHYEREKKERQKVAAALAENDMKAAGSSKCAGKKEKKSKVSI